MSLPVLLGFLGDERIVLSSEMENTSGDEGVGEEVDTDEGKTGVSGILMHELSVVGGKSVMHESLQSEARGHA